MERYRPYIHLVPPWMLYIPKFLCYMIQYIHYKYQRVLPENQLIRLMLHIIDMPLNLILVLVMWGIFPLLFYHFPTCIIPFIPYLSTIIVGNYYLRSSHFANIILIIPIRMRLSLHAYHEEIVRYNTKRYLHTQVCLNRF